MVNLDRFQQQPEDSDPGATGRSVAAKKLYIKTYGCQMNVYDSQRMADTLAPLGYRQSESPEEADLILLNTCHIREKASEKVFSELGRLRLLQEAAAEEGRRLLIGVAGCVAQAEGEEIVRRAPQVDLVVGPQTYHRLPDLVNRALGGERGRNLVDTDFPAESKFDFLPEEAASPGPAAFLSVQEGCDKFCSFCVVPYTRGAEVSRPVSQVVAEARGLVEAGVKEITLLARTSTPITGWTGPAVPSVLGNLPICWRNYPALSACATQPATRSTWMMP